MYEARIEALAKEDWDFVEEDTGGHGHRLHPYTGKFIPQIPRRLIETLSRKGERVADPFCGSGTTLVEGLALGRHVVGVDQHPVATTISKAKTTRIGNEDTEALARHLKGCTDLAASAGGKEEDLFRTHDKFKSTGWRPPQETMKGWIDEHVVEELAELGKRIDAIEEEAARTLAKAVWSAIVTGVSRQDGETRYVRTQRRVPEGETLARYNRKLREAMSIAQKWSRETRGDEECRVIEANVRSHPDLGRVHLVVTSPPYPNAYDYHLYHRLRILWLGGEAKRVRDGEIGSHQGISNRKTPNEVAAAFGQEMEEVLGWLGQHLQKGRHCCFVIGDSVVKGETIYNADIIEQAGKAQGYELAGRWQRRIASHRKSINPVMGRAKDEWIVVLAHNQKG